jgi:hypothetical protein
VLQALVREVGAVRSVAGFALCGYPLHTWADCSCFDLPRQKYFNYLEHAGTTRLEIEIITPQFAHTMFLRVSCGSHIKLRLFPQTALTGWYL